MSTDHWIVADWTCCCGEDCFGGSAAYSWLLFESHAEAERQASTPTQAHATTEPDGDADE